MGRGLPLLLILSSLFSFTALAEERALLQTQLRDLQARHEATRSQWRGKCTQAAVLRSPLDWFSDVPAPTVEKIVNGQGRFPVDVRVLSRSFESLSSRLVLTEEERRMVSEVIERLESIQPPTSIELDSEAGLKVRWKVTTLVSGVIYRIQERLFNEAIAGLESQWDASWTGFFKNPSSECARAKLTLERDVVLASIVAAWLQDLNQIELYGSPAK